MKVRYAPRAIRDLHAITDYIKTRNPRAADRVETAITGSIDHLRRNPNLGALRPGMGRGVRALCVPRFSYTIYYRADPEVIVIIHIRDARRRLLRRRK